MGLLIVHRTLKLWSYESQFTGIDNYLGPELQGLLKVKEYLS